MFLSPEEKECARLRMSRDSSSVVNSKFVLKDALKICYEDKFFFAYMMVGVSNGVPLFSVSTFLVQIVERLGSRHHRYVELEMYKTTSEHRRCCLEIQQSTL